MIKEHLSPHNAQRLRLFEAYRGRGRRIANLFLVYSIKTDRDWIISGDRRFIHWIYYLEIDPSVKSFEFTSEFDRNKERVWVVDVLLSNGTRVTHYVGHSLNDDHAALEARVFTDEILRPVVKVSLRWSKAIGFAAALRNYEHPHHSVALLEYFRQQRNGNVGQVLREPDLCEDDPARTLGLIVRFGIRGQINLDLTSNSFGYNTPWRLSNGG